MIEQKIASLLEQGKAPVLVTIIDKGGSAPRLPGSKMLVEEDGTTHGTIGGGGLELTLTKKALDVASSGVSILAEFTMQGSGAPGDAEMVCGGKQLVLIEPLQPDQASMFAAARDSMGQREPGLWFLAISDSGRVERRFVDLREDEPILEGVDLRAVLQSRRTQLLKTADGTTLMVEPLAKRGTVVLVGGGHVARETARLAAFVDFELVVVDDRPDFCSSHRFPMARSTHLVPGLTRVFETVPVDGDTYLLIMTHSHGLDQQVLAQALRTSARYIGMIGSSRKRRVIFSNLKEQGFSDQDLERVYCPVGLDIGSETPAEIAVSIIAQIIAVRAGVSSPPAPPLQK